MCAQEPRAVTLRPLEEGQQRREVCAKTPVTYLYLYLRLHPA
jgi:hypothetical protein